jgi:flagellar motor switch protein FliN/FliY
MSDKTSVDNPDHEPVGQSEEFKVGSPKYPAFDEGMEAKPGGEILGGDSKSLELLQDVSLEVTVELGRARTSIGEVMELGQGSVIELNKMAGEPVDVRVNGVLMATGEVVILDDVFGVRITRLNNRISNTSGKDSGA